MRSKASLVLMEQLIMLLVFALAAAACLGIFSAAHTISQSAVHQDAAVILARNGAETVKGCAGDLSAAAEILRGTLDGDTLTVSYDDALLPSSDGCYCLSIQITDSRVSGLGQAALQVIHRSEPSKILFSLNAAWQEVD